VTRETIYGFIAAKKTTYTPLRRHSERKITAQNEVCA
jgi:hypothetical protein